MDGRRRELEVGERWSRRLVKRRLGRGIMCKIGFYEIDEAIHIVLFLMRW